MTMIFRRASPLAAALAIAVVFFALTVPGRAEGEETESTDALISIAIAEGISARFWVPTEGSSDDDYEITGEIDIADDGPSHVRVKYTSQRDRGADLIPSNSAVQTTLAGATGPTAALEPFTVHSPAPGIHRISIAVHTPDLQTFRGGPVEVRLKHPSAVGKHEFFNPVHVLRISADYDRCKMHYVFVDGTARSRPMSADQCLTGERGRNDHLIGHHAAGFWNLAAPGGAPNL